MVEVYQEVWAPKRKGGGAAWAVGPGEIGGRGYTTLLFLI